MKIALEPINCGGRLFMPGEQINGYIDPEILETLERNGKVGDADEDLSEAKTVEKPKSRRRGVKNNDL